MTHQYRPDWAALLCRLRTRTGTPLARIAPRVGMCEKTINRLARGEVAEPRFTAGLALLDLAADALDPEDWPAIRRGGAG
ncbi:MAG: hypothetical protein EOM21_19195, partial [Gammaproteobacteria bacterium]|nr:hypothetical protein [Gammaproteobacteria bacterium]